MKTTIHLVLLKAAKKAMRDTCHQVKPMVVADKRKVASKRACRTRNFEEQ
jgi:hypothetical protein